MAKFMDVNIRVGGENSDQNLLEVARLAVKLGYETLCFNNFTESLSIKTGKKEKTKDSAIKSPDGFRLKKNDLDQLQLQYQGKRNIEQFTRFSTVLSDPAQVVRLQNDEVIQSYDLLAVEPTTEKLFLTACKELPIDIISLDLTQRLPFLPKRTAVGCALERGVMFEICYAPMIRDSSGGMSSARRYVISNSNTLVNICQSKNIVISSGALNAMELRGPLDICNFDIRLENIPDECRALLFGIKENKARACLSANCHSAIMHSVARKSSRGMLSMRKISCIADKDLRKISEISSNKLKTATHSAEAAAQSAAAADGLPASAAVGLPAAAHQKCSTEALAAAGFQISVPTDCSSTEVDTGSKRKRTDDISKVKNKKKCVPSV